MLARPPARAPPCLFCIDAPVLGVACVPTFGRFIPPGLMVEGRVTGAPGFAGRVNGAAGRAPGVPGRPPGFPGRIPGVPVRPGSVLGDPGLPVRLPGAGRACRPPTVFAQLVLRCTLLNRFRFPALILRFNTFLLTLMLLKRLPT